MSGMQCAVDTSTHSGLTISKKVQGWDILRHELFEGGLSSSSDDEGEVMKHRTRSYHRFCKDCSEEINRLATAELSGTNSVHESRQRVLESLRLSMAHIDQQPSHLLVEETTSSHHKNIDDDKLQLMDDLCTTEAEILSLEMEIARLEQELCSSDGNIAHEEVMLDNLQTDQLPYLMQLHVTLEAEHRLLESAIRSTVLAPKPFTRNVSSLKGTLWSAQELYRQDEVDLTAEQSAAQWRMRESFWLTPVSLSPLFDRIRIVPVQMESPIENLNEDTPSAVSSYSLDLASQDTNVIFSESVSSSSTVFTLEGNKESHRQFSSHHGKDEDEEGRGKREIPSLKSSGNRRQQSEWLVVLNGQRLAFLPIPRLMLNWAEISAGWCLLVMFLVTLRATNKLPSSRNVICCARKSWPQLLEFLRRDLQTEGINLQIPSHTTEFGEYLDDERELDVEIQLATLTDSAVLIVRRNTMPSHFDSTSNNNTTGNTASSIMNPLGSIFVRGAAFLGASSMLSSRIYLNEAGDQSLPISPFPSQKNLISNDSDPIPHYSRAISSNCISTGEAEELFLVGGVSTEMYSRAVLALLTAIVATKLSIVESGLAASSYSPGAAHEFLSILFPSRKLQVLALALLCGWPIGYEYPFEEFTSASTPPLSSYSSCSTMDDVAAMTSRRELLPLRPVSVSNSATDSNLSNLTLAQLYRDVLQKVSSRGYVVNPNNNSIMTALVIDAVTAIATTTDPPIPTV